MMQTMESQLYGTKKKQIGEKQTTWKEKMRILFIERGLFFILIGFLLGRAVILSAVSPFAIAFLASVWLIQRNKLPHTMLAVSLGALSFSLQHALFTGLAAFVFLLLSVVMKQTKREKIFLPFAVALATIGPRIFMYSLQGPLTTYEWMLLSVEAVLGAILVLIFMQGIPIISPKRYTPSLKNEEIVSFIILLASILTGTIGWQLYGAAIEQVFSRYFVLVFALIGGPAIGATVGVVVGLILSLANIANLYQMSLLAFSGLLGGLLKEGRKIGVAAGLFVGTFLMAIYGNELVLSISVTESVFAILLFLLTPASWLSSIAKYIPGTEEHTKEQQQYLYKVRDLTAKRMHQFSDVFHALSNSFSSTNETPTSVQMEKRDTDEFLSQVTERTCQVCFMKERCWQKEFDKTYTVMETMKEDIVDGGRISPKTLRTFENHCVKSKKVVEVMNEEMNYFKASQRWKHQVLESKRLVADQLFGVSEVMDDFANEILKEREQYERQEIEITHALNNLGLELEKLEIYQLEKGNVDIEMTASFFDYHGEAEKLVAPVLSDLLNEIIVVKSEEVSPFPNGYSHFSFGSAKAFVVESGVSSAAKGGAYISGDSYKTMELGEGKYALAISDGMGNGKRAQEESFETLRLLQQILQIGIPEKVAIKSINSILALRTTDEVFATLDLAVIDLNHAYVKFLKVSASPSYIKRGNEVLKVESSNLPIGIIPEVEIDIVSDELKSGDILIMISDGVFDGPKHIENTDRWVRRKLKEFATDDPQEIADLLLEEVIRLKDGEIDDDMTILVSKVSKNKPKWASVPVHPTVMNKKVSI